MSKAVTTPILPAHIEGTVQAIARFHAEHYEQATPLQKGIERLTARAGQPRFVVILTVLSVGWIGLNLFMKATGQKPFDEPPFNWLQGARHPQPRFIFSSEWLRRSTFETTTNRFLVQLGSHPQLVAATSHNWAIPKSFMSEHSCHA